MFGLTQHHELLLTSTLTHAARVYPEVEVISQFRGRETRTSYGEIDVRARRLASALAGVSIGPGDMAGALAWTTHRYLELFHAVPGIGAVLHTANPRQTPARLADAVNQCGYSVLFIDPETASLAREIAALAPSLKHLVCMGAPEDIPADCISFEKLIAAGDPAFAWPDFDERTASTLCFTSGTTGAPKGALYSHRGTLLNAMAEAAPNSLGLSDRDTALAISPFFHCNGWGLPYMAPMTGARLVLPGRDLSPGHLQGLIQREGVTFTGAVPTVLLDLIRHCRENGLNLKPLERLLSGGSAPSASLIETLWSEFGVKTIHAWGMTETTSGVTFTRPLPDPAWPADPTFGYPQGRAIFGAAVRAVGGSEGAPGKLQAQGHWMAAEYFGRPDIPLSTEDGWMETGDLGVVTDAHAMRILDRDKDAIKSGGEWISSQDLENAAMEVAGVAAAAAIPIPDPRWVERPLLLVVREALSDVTKATIEDALASRFQKWQLPDRIQFIEAMPLTPVGKIDKRALRAEYPS